MSPREMPDTRESEAVVSSGEMGMVRQELSRLGKDLREGLADMREDLRTVLSELRGADADQARDIADLRVAIAKVPSEERLKAVEAESKKHGEELARIAVRIGIWGALAGIAAAGVVEAIAKALFHG